MAACVFRDWANRASLGEVANAVCLHSGVELADLLINKPLGLSPSGIEFRRAYLYDLNPVGLGSSGPRPPV